MSKPLKVMIVVSVGAIAVGLLAAIWLAVYRAAFNNGIDAIAIGVVAGGLTVLCVLISVTFGSLFIKSDDF